MKGVPHGVLPSLHLQRDQIFGVFCILRGPLADATRQFLVDESINFICNPEGASRLTEAGALTLVFDCSNEGAEEIAEEIRALEIEVVLDESVPPERIRYAPPCDALLQMGYEDTYASEMRNYDVSHADIPTLIAMLEDAELNGSVGPMVWAPYHAMMALGQLRAEAAVPALIRAFLRTREGDLDDPLYDHVPTVLGLIGAPAFGPVAEVAANPTLSKSARVSACDSMRQIAVAHPETREACIAAYRAIIENRNHSDRDINGWALAGLTELGAAESATVVEQAFAEDRINPIVAGDWEDAQIAFGLRTTRTHPRKQLRELLPGGDDLPDLDEDPFAKASPFVRTAPKVGRNEPCPCGSGKKFKKCCGA